MSTPARTNERVSAVGLGMASLGSNGHAAWEPNWIDFRSSVANVERRRDVGEVPATCDGCGCETDITPVPHSPKCPTLTHDQWTRVGMLEAVEAWAVAHDDQPPVASDWTRETVAHPAARQAVVEFGSFSGFLEEAGFSANTPRRRGRRLGPPAELDGRELLDRMDAGEPLNDDKAGLEEASEPVGAGAGASPSPGGLEEAAAVGQTAVSGAAPVVGEPERAATSSSSKAKWTRERVIAAIREVAAKVGHTPSRAEMQAHGYGAAPQTSTTERLGTTWADLVREAGYEPLAKGAGVGRRRKRSEREPQAEEDAAGPTEPALERPVSPPPGQAGEAASRSENNRGRARAWSPEDVLDAIRRWNDEYGHPPTSTEWMRRVDGYPTTTTVASRFGSWANAIEQAGFDRPKRGGIPLRPLAAPAKRVRVRGTGLTYRTAEEAYVAADELEADGERVAEQARFDRNEAKAEQAIDQSRELAEKIRDAAHAFEARHSAGANGTAPMVEPEERLPVFPPQPEVEKPEEPMRLLVTPDEMPPFQRAIARSLIAGMRAAADALEQELA